MLHSAFSLLTKKKNLVASCSIFFHVLIFFFIGILSNINKIFTFLHFLPETPKLRAGQTFLTVPYFQTCSKRWNARHILSCAPQEPGRRLDSTALPTPHKRSRQGDGEAVCLTLGFFLLLWLIFMEFFNRNTPWLPWLLQGAPLLLWWLWHCWQVGSCLSLAVHPIMQGFDIPIKVVPRVWVSAAPWRGSAQEQGKAAS